jgi:hypothetical protein
VLPVRVAKCAGSERHVEIVVSRGIRPVTSRPAAPAMVDPNGRQISAPHHGLINIHDGLGIGEAGGEIAKLVGHGFVEISTANGQDAIAKVTRAGRT